MFKVTDVVLAFYCISEIYTFFIVCIVHFEHVNGNYVCFLTTLPHIVVIALCNRIYPIVKDSLLLFYH